MPINNEILDTRPLNFLYCFRKVSRQEYLKKREEKKLEEIRYNGIHSVGTVVSHPYYQCYFFIWGQVSILGVERTLHSSLNYFCFLRIVISFSLSLSSSHLFFDFSNFVVINTRDDIEDEQYLFEGVKLTDAEYRELR